MIDLQDVIRIHEILIDHFGGSKGIRDHGLLESAISRPFQTFDKNDLYSNPVEKSAALIESIIINHPFVDGNKRIGYVLMRILLMEFGFDIIATEEEKYDFVIKIADARSGLNQKAIPENECFFEMPLIVRFHGRVLQKKLPNINFIDNKKA